ncbi:hypothetical protein CEXT_168781, partial [Caerostris extrusa]
QTRLISDLQHFGYPSTELFNTKDQSDFVDDAVAEGSQRTLIQYCEENWDILFKLSAVYSH